VKYIFKLRREPKLNASKIKMRVKRIGEISHKKYVVHKRPTRVAEHQVIAKDIDIAETINQLLLSTAY